MGMGEIKLVTLERSCLSDPSLSECMFDEPVADLSVLSDCLFVQSNPNLAPSAVGSVATGRLTRIEGDVILANIPPERLAFLKKKTTLNGTICRVSAFFQSIIYF